MKISLKSVKRFLPVFLLMQCIAMPVQAYWIYYQPAPVVIYQNNPAADAVALGICALGVGVYAGISGWLQDKAERRQFNQYTEMFKNLGYDTAQAQVYAKLAVNNLGGYQAVIANIEREKEQQRHVEAQQQLKNTFYMIIIFITSLLALVACLFTFLKKSNNRKNT